MPALTQADLATVTRNAFKRVNSKEPTPIDIKKRPWLKFLESKREDSLFEGGVALYPLLLSFNDPGQTWSGDDEIEATDPDFQINLEFGYFNYTTAIIIKHDKLTRMGFSVVPNGDGLIEGRAMGKDMAFKIQNYVKGLVRQFKDNHDKYLDLLLLRSGAASPNDPVGLFGILTQNNAIGNVGGLSRVDYPQLRHVVQTGLTPTAGGDFRDLMDQTLAVGDQYSNQNGVDGNIDWMMGGSTFIRGYKSWGELNNYRVDRTIDKKLKVYDFGIPDDSLQYQEIPIVRNWSLDAVDALDTFSPTLTKSLVMLNSATWFYKSLPGKYKKLTSPADPPKQRVTREDIDTTAHLGCSAPASNAVAYVD
jgi:hypothetical protein